MLRVLSSCYVHLHVSILTMTYRNHLNINIDSATSFLIHFIRLKGDYLDTDVFEIEDVDIQILLDTFLVHIEGLLANN